MPEFVVLARLHRLIKDAFWKSEDGLCLAIDAFLEDVRFVARLRCHG